ncbi:MAG: hypothetical protein K1X53_06635 [Candidatus Sumerlaeaceae bacterium]|nr:hypothetical protein [Candidatus Sumerlaeaceae bacterium]
MATVMKKEDAHRIVDNLPADATWDDLMHQIYVREAVERGLSDSREDRASEVAEVRAKYGLEK